jgi:hypothetical protein
MEIGVKLVSDFSMLLEFYMTYANEFHKGTRKYCNGPLPLNGQLVTDVIFAVTDTDSHPITRNGWAKHCIRGNRYALRLDRSVSPVTNR